MNKINSFQNLQPESDEIYRLSRMLVKRYENENIQKKYAPIKHVLALAGGGLLVGLMLAAPNSARGVKPFLNQDHKPDLWKKYNKSYLCRSIKSLQKQKLVNVHTDISGQSVISITRSGRKQILHDALTGLDIQKPARWDGMWRLVIYDVSDAKKKMRDVFRRTLKSIGFHQLQKSIWIFPFDCQDQISFLREYCGVGDEVIYIEAIRMEDDAPYRDYFGLTV